MRKQLLPFLFAVLLSMVGAISYAQDSQTKRTIHVETAGTLSNYISNEEKYLIEELTLTGELNGSDIKFLWDMSGTTWSYFKYEDKYYYEVYSEGKLKVLDITDTKIVEGGGWYFTWDYDESGRARYSSNNTISENMFRGCRTLTSIKLPNSVTSIQKYAFPGGLTSIKIPSSVTSIEEYTFPGGLTSINVESGNQNYDSRNNCNAIIETKSNKLIAGCKSTIIPNSVTSIGSGAFSGCSGLTSVTIPNSVTSIGFGAFSGCSGLTSVTIPNSVTSIGIGAFKYCSGLTSIFVESGNAKYDSRDNCNGIIETQSNTLITGCQNTIIPSSVTSIEDYAFNGCKGLTSVTIPNSVTRIGGWNGTFYDCNSLTSIVSQIKDPFVISDYVFPYYIYSTATLTVPYGTKSLYESTNGWKKFQNIVEAPSPKCTIHVSTAGTLPDLISEEEKYKIEELALTGELNGTDFKYIREMAGDSIYGYYNIDGEIIHKATNGKLKSLDISEANIVKGGAAYSYYLYGVPNEDGSSGAPPMEIFTDDNIISQKLFSKTLIESIILPQTVTSIESRAFWGCSNLTSVTIPNNLTSIGYYAFSGCSSLTTIKIPNSITSIGTNAFNETAWYNNQPDGLVYAGTFAYKYKGEMPTKTDVTIIDGTKGIADGAFSSCSNLRNINIPNSVISIGNSAFSGCSGLTSVTVPNSVTSIGNSAFSGCSGLTSISIPNSVISIGNSAFCGCSSLTSVTIPNSVITIGSSSFAECSSLTSVTIPNSVTSIESGAFHNCSALTSITIPNTVLSIDARALKGTGWYNNQSDGILYLDNCLLGYKGDIKPNGLLDIKEGTRLIAGFSFSGCSNLTSIIIPNSVTFINNNAFYDCDGLTSITIPNSVVNIGDGAFSWCDGLTSIKSRIANPFVISDYVFSNYPTAILTVPIGTKAIHQSTDGWKKFQNIVEAPSPKRTIYVATAGTLPDLISEDEKYEIEELTLTGELNGTDFKYIREMAGVKDYYEPDGPDFVLYHSRTNGQLQSLDILNANIVKGGSAYNFYWYLEPTPELGDSFQGYQPSDLYISDNCISGHLFSLTLLESIVLPNNVVSIGDYAFYGCSNLANVTIPNSVTSIGRSAFYETPWYNNQPDGLVYAGKVAYKYKGTMPENTSITIKDGTLGIASRAFQNCNGLTSISIPNSVTSIGDYAFSSCSGLTSITIPNSVTSIGNSAFSSCSGLTSVTIPNSVTSISDGAFSSCSGLTSVTIPNSVTSIGGSAFSSCSGLTSVTIPNSVTSIGGSAFYSCSSLTSITIPNSVTSIGGSAFYNTGWYQNQADGLLYLDKWLIGYKGDQPVGEPRITEGTFGIAGYAFYNCSGLTSVTIPNSVTSIGNEAFYGCSGLTSVTIPNNVTSIGWGAFYNLNGLKKVLSKIKKPFKIDVFNRLPSDAELIVPIGTKSLYEAMNGWNKFSTITEHLPTLETQPAHPMSTTKARLIANVDEEDDDQHFGFEWLRYDAPESMPPYKVSAPLYDGCIVGSLSGLNPDKYYKYRPYYQSDLGETVFGEWITFNTGDANVFFEPEVHTKEATAVTNNSAQLSAVFVEGTDDIQEKGFEYWTVSGSTTRAINEDAMTVAIIGSNTSVTLTGLKAGTEYGYCSYVKTTSGKTYGEEKTFKTQLLGDANNDGKVDAADIVEIVNAKAGKPSASFNMSNADTDGDSNLTDADINTIVKIIIGK